MHPQKPTMTYDESAFPPLNKNTNKTMDATSKAQPSKALATPTPATSTPATYNYHTELQCITQEIEMSLKAKLADTLTQLNEKFEQKLRQIIEQNVDQKLQHLKPIATAQAELQHTQANQAKDIEQITKNMDYLMSQVANIADQLKQFTTVLTHPMLSNSIRKS